MAWHRTKYPPINRSKTMGFVRRAKTSGRVFVRCLVLKCVRNGVPYEINGGGFTRNRVGCQDCAKEHKRKRSKADYNAWKAEPRPAPMAGTPDDDATIQQRIAEVQSTWSEVTRQQRTVGALRNPPADIQEIERQEVG